VVIDVNLAVKLGVNEAIVLQQINYWIEANKKAGRNFEEGRYWTYNSIKEWHEQLPFLAEKTIKRAIDNLKNKDILITDNFNKAKFDRTLWYTIDFEKLEDLFIEKELEETGDIDLPKRENALGQNDPMEEDNLTQPIGQNDPMQRDNLTQPIPKTNTETTTETNTEINIHIGAPPVKSDAKRKHNDPIEQIFTAYVQGDAELLQALMDFVKMRKAIRSPLSTERAAKMLLNNLDALASTALQKIDILNQSILNNWKGVFELKNTASNTIYKGNGYSVENGNTPENNAFHKLKAKYGGD
jgi:hypothetical protein